MEVTKKGLVISNLIWKLLERFGAQGVTFVVSIVLARLLDPDVYGTVAIITVFTAILQVFVDSGLGNALIQKKDADDVDFSTVFFFNLVMCVVLYMWMFWAAPLIAAFYEKAELTILVRVLSLTLIISGIKNVQQAYVSRHLMFKKFFRATIGGTIGGAVLGLWMAYKGYGVWALVTQSLFSLTIDTSILWITVKWRPVFKFSWQRLRNLLSYGWKLLVSSLIDVGYKELRSIIIGKRYSLEDLAFYNRGEQFPILIVANVNASIDSILLPIMSSEQNNRDVVRTMTRRAIKTSTYVMTPLMVGLAICAEPIVRLILTDKWLPCVVYLRIFCISYAFYPIQTANLNAIKAMGRSDIFLKLEIVKKSIGLISLVATMFISVKAVAYSMVFTAVMSQVINAWPNKKLLNYDYISQLRDMLPQIVISLLMGAGVYGISFIPIADGVQLIVQILVGIVLYICFSILFRIESFFYILELGKSLISINKRKD